MPSIATRMILASFIGGLAIPALALAAESDDAAPSRSYGQYLVDRAVARHPELLGLDLQTTPPNGSESVVIASKDREHLGRKIALRDADAAKVAIDAATGQRAVELPLQDKTGNTIGAIRAVYAYSKGDDEMRLVSQAEALRGEMRGQIPTAARLVQPMRPTDGLDIGGTQSLPTTKE